MNYRLLWLFLLLFVIPVFSFAENRASSAVAEKAIKIFVRHCFNPYLTAITLQRKIKTEGIHYDFYDLEPFSSDNVPSPVKARARTPGTDRRCEISFLGREGVRAANAVAKALQAEGILKEARLPVLFEQARLPGSSLLAARWLNTQRKVVVHTGIRQAKADANNMETFLLVERLTPTASRL